MKAVFGVIFRAARHSTKEKQQVPANVILKT